MAAEMAIHKLIVLGAWVCLPVAGIGRTMSQRILAIEYDPSVNNRVRMLLANAGYQAVAASDLREAIRLLGSLTLNTVIANGTMELSHSRGARRALLEMMQWVVDHLGPRVILITGREELSQSACQLDVAAFSNMPFEFDDFSRRAMEGGDN